MPLDLEGGTRLRYLQSQRARAHSNESEPSVTGALRDFAARAWCLVFRARCSARRRGYGAHMSGSCGESVAEVRRERAHRAAERALGVGHEDAHVAICSSGSVATSQAAD